MTTKNELEKIKELISLIPERDEILRRVEAVEKNLKAHEKEFGTKTSALDFDAEQPPVSKPAKMVPIGRVKRRLSLDD
jgi:hypothetical protein